MDLFDWEQDSLTSCSEHKALIHHQLSDCQLPKDCFVRFVSYSLRNQCFNPYVDAGVTFPFVLFLLSYVSV